MTNNQEWQILVDRYFRGELNSAEFAAFEQLQKENPEFLNFFEERQAAAVADGLTYIDEKEAFKKKLADLARIQANVPPVAETDPTKHNQKSNTLLWIILSLLLVLLCWLLWVKFSNPLPINDPSQGESSDTELIESGNTEPEEKDAQLNQAGEEDDPSKEETTNPVEDQNTQKNKQRAKNQTTDQGPQIRMIAMADDFKDRYFEEDYSFITTRSGQIPDQLDTLGLAINAFSDKDWDKAIALFEQFQEVEDYSDEFGSLGFAYLQTGKIDKAIAVFTKLKNNSLRPEWSNKGQWYLLLAYLQGGTPYEDIFKSSLEDLSKQSEFDQDITNRLQELRKQYEALKD